MQCIAARGNGTTKEWDEFRARRRMENEDPIEEFSSDEEEERMREARRKANRRRPLTLVFPRPPSPSLSPPPSPPSLPFSVQEEEPEEEPVRVKRPPPNADEFKRFSAKSNFKKR